MFGFSSMLMFVVLTLWVPFTSSQTTRAEERGGLGLPQTLESDKEALLEIKDWLLQNTQRNDSQLENWTSETDPCNTPWQSVFCACEVVRQLESGALICDGHTPPKNRSRVLALRLAGAVSADEKWTGELSPAVGKLDQLLMLQLDNNAFEGGIPDAFASLSELRLLSLSKNQLTGEIPEFFANYTKIVRIELDDNDFHGSVPEMACHENRGNVTRVLLQGNKQLCGTLPECMQGIVPDVNGTFLDNPNIDDKNHTSGVCDDTEPECAQECVLRLPPYWTNVQNVTFNFTAFEDNVGLQKYRIDVVQVEKNLSASAGVPPIITNVTDIESLVVREGFVRFNGPLRDRLISGNLYNVTVIARNKAGPPLEASVSGGPVLVDDSAPVLGTETQGMVHNTPNQTTEVEQEQGSRFGVSWSAPFTEPESEIARIHLRIHEYPVTQLSDAQDPVVIETVNLTDLNTRSWEFSENISSRLLAHRKYEYQIAVRNVADLEEVFVSASFTVTDTHSSFPRAVVWGVGAVIIFLIGAASAGVLVYNLPRMWKTSQFDPDEYLKKFLYELVDVTVEEPRQPSGSVLGQRELAFVITDVESSTAQSTANETAFTQLNHIHNMIIRDTYEEYSGYEIHTEGDSFQLAFGSVAVAIRFCVTVQQKFLDFKWSADILRLPGCSISKDPRGKGIVFRGPRVRMAVHWALKDFVRNTIHPFTKHMIYEGPAFETAKELSGAARGGQILLSHDAWVHLGTDFPKAGFPTIELMGSWKLDTWPEAMLIYNISQRVGKRLVRRFPYPSNIECVELNAGMHIIPPPIPDNDSLLAFVAVRIETIPDDPSSQLVGMTFGLISQYAQYFAGHVFQEIEDEGVASIAFGTPLDAVRFGEAIQMALVLQNWPVEIINVCGPTVPGPDHIPLFHGPRVVVAIHVTRSFGISLQSEHSDTDNGAATYRGHGVSFTRLLADVGHGGQVILTKHAWKEVQNTMPVRSQALNLGQHIMDAYHTRPVWLFEVLPQSLGEREFPKIKTKEQLEPGYREAPSIDQDICIVFAKAEKPQLIRRFEERRNLGEASEKEIRDMIAVYYESLSMFSAVVIRRLRSYDGYQCKEPERGKFTVAFSKLSDAILWGCHVHAELLTLDWPEKLLKMDECGLEQREGRTIHRGLRVKIGMAHGKVYERRPINTGRADYFGQIPNLAARVSALARPGQVLLHPSSGLDSTGVTWIVPNEAGLLSYKTPLEVDTDGVSEAAVEITKLGMFLLRGANELKLLYQAQPASVAERERFGRNDVASMYSGGAEPKATGFWSSLLRRNFLLKRLHDASSSFLSYTSHQPGPSSSSLSRPCSTRTFSPPPKPRAHQLTPSPSQGSARNGVTMDLQEIYTEAEEQGEEEHTGSELETLPSITPPTPFFGEMTDDLHHRSVFGPSSSVLEQQPIVTNSHRTDWKEISTVAKRDSGHSDDCIVSIGNIDSSRMVPPKKDQGSSDEETSPAEYGLEVASMYSNLADAGRSAVEFSFCSQKSDSPNMH